MFAPMPVRAASYVLLLLLIMAAALNVQVSDAQGDANYTILYVFGSEADKELPEPGVAFDNSGDMYGTAHTPRGGCVWELSHLQFSVVHTFGGYVRWPDGSTGPDGHWPMPSALVIDPNDNLFGNTAGGGVRSYQEGSGVFYEVTSSGEYKILLICQPNGSTGSAGRPSRFEVVGSDAAGNVYGNGDHGIWKMNPRGRFTYLYDLSHAYSRAWGAEVDAAGNIYGWGLINQPVRHVLIWKLSPSRRLSQMCDESQQATAADGTGTRPRWQMSTDFAVDGQGNLYGVCPGGSSKSGMLIEVTASGSAIDLHDFSAVASQNDGSMPAGKPVLDAAGNIYGTTLDGGTQGGGILWEYTRNLQYLVLHNFGDGPKDGIRPDGEIAISGIGSICGLASTNGGPQAAMVWRYRPN